MPTRTFPSFEAYFAANAKYDLRGMVLGRNRQDWVMTQLMVNNAPETMFPKDVLIQSAESLCGSTSSKSTFRQLYANGASVVKCATKPRKGRSRSTDRERIYPPLQFLQRRPLSSTQSPAA